MHYNKFLIATSLVLLVSCQTPRKRSEVVGLHPGVVGQWQATMPCADCPGIDYRLMLAGDGSYREEMRYAGKSDSTFTRYGKWFLSEDSVVRLEKREGAGQQFFKWRTGRLTGLDAKGSPIVSGKGQVFFLEKHETGQQEGNGTGNEGIDFLATGNEPFWALKIDFEKLMIFTSLNEPDTVITQVPEGIQRHNLTLSTFTAETENGSLTVTISGEECSDTMSGKNYGYKVTVLAKNAAMREAVEYTGCGRYYDDSPLNGAWQLQSVDSQQATDLFSGKIPYLQFDVGERKVSGNGGCNYLSGSVEVDGGMIRFSPLIATKMACPAIAGEQQLLSVLSEQELAYEVENDRLVLEGGNKRLIFNRMEQAPQK